MRWPLHEAEDAVGTPSVEAELVEGFGFFELKVAFVGGGGEVNSGGWGVFSNHLDTHQGFRGEKSLAFFDQALSSEYQ